MNKAMKKELSRKPQRYIHFSGIISRNDNKKIRAKMYHDFIQDLFRLVELYDCGSGCAFELSDSEDPSWEKKN